jgi:gluconokinase
VTSPVGPVPVILLVMGVSGSGKSTIGALLAERLGWPYVDADDFHSGGNIAKMRGGVPLSDRDRWPWLASMCTWMDREIAAGRCAVTSGSALKRRYRDMLRRGRPELRLIYLRGDRTLITRRLGDRMGHFFPPELLDSQLRALEPPHLDEGVLTVSAGGTPEEIVVEILTRLKLRRGGID